MPQDITSYNFIKQLKELPFVEAIWIFGSRARAEHHERSDIDLAIVCPKAADLDWLKVMAIVEKADTLLKIDCIRFEKKTINDTLYQNILKDKKVIYMKEISWKDYFYTLGNAIRRLKEVLDHPQLNEIEYMRDASIQRFEFTIELFWKVLKKVLFHEKIEAITPRETFSKAFQYKLIDNEEIWLSMLDDRNNTSHAYKEEQAKLIFEHIKQYMPVFEETYEHLKNKYQL